MCIFCGSDLWATLGTIDRLTVWDGGTEGKGKEPANREGVREEQGWECHHYHPRLVLSGTAGSNSGCRWLVWLSCHTDTQQTCTEHILFAKQCSQC